MLPGPIIILLYELDISTANLIERPKVIPNKPRTGSSLTTVPLSRSVACPLQNLGEEKNSFECFSCTFHHQGVNSILNKTFSE